MQNLFSNMLIAMMLIVALGFAFVDNAKATVNTVAEFMCSDITVNLNEGKHWHVDCYGWCNAPVNVAETPYWSITPWEDCWPNDDSFVVVTLWMKVYDPNYELPPFGVGTCPYASYWVKD
jgi:hypothetical protein